MKGLSKKKIYTHTDTDKSVVIATGKGGECRWSWTQGRGIRM